MLHFAQQEAQLATRKINQPKEFEMFSNRLFNFVVVITMLVAIGFTVREVAATAIVAAPQGSAESVCGSLPTHDSVHTEYVTEKGVWVTYTENYPTGIDGGLIQLLSDNRACSK